MVLPEDAGAVRMAHIFELDTSRLVVDAFVDASPRMRVVESSMDSRRQLEALMMGQLDVAIIRVTAGMMARYPSGWDFRLLRLEPFWLVGRPGDPPREQASLQDRPVEVFADGPASPLYNVHGEYMTSFEQQSGVALSWLGNPGTYENCLAILNRSSHPAYLMEFDSYARRYAEQGLPIHRPVELQPVYPWSIAWRDEPPSEAVARFVQVALATAAQQRVARRSSRHGAAVVPGRRPDARPGRPGRGVTGPAGYRSDSERTWTPGRSRVSADQHEGACAGPGPDAADFALAGRSRPRPQRPGWAGPR